jgi:mRNA interferase MazF
MNRGDVVEVNWPYSDLSGTKIRPAVVVQADFLNNLIEDTTFVKITSRKFGIPGSEVVLDPAVETDSGLRKSCVASCNNFLTRDQAIAGPVIGFLSASAMQRIEECLKKVLEIR